MLLILTQKTKQKTFEQLKETFVKFFKNYSK